MTIDSWERFYEIEALMMPGTGDLDPIDVAHRSGEPVGPELPTRRAWTRGNSAAGECVDCGRHQDKRYTGRCARCYKRMSKATDAS